MNKEDKKILFRTVKLFKPYMKTIVCLIICMFISAGISFVIPLLSKLLMDSGLLGNSMSNVIKYSIAIFLLVLIGQVIDILGVKYEAILNTNVPYELTLMAFRKTLKLNMSYLKKINATQLMGNISLDVKSISSLVNKQTFFIVMQFFNIIGGVIGLLMIDVKLTFIVIIVAPLRYFSVKYLSKKRKENYEEYMKNCENYSSWYGDTLNGIKEIKSLVIEDIKINEFIENQKFLNRNNIKFFYQEKFNLCLESLTIEFITTSIYIFGAYLIFSKHLSIGGLFAFITYSYKVTSPISTLVGIKFNYVELIPSAKRFFEFIDMKEEIQGNLTVDNVYPVLNIDFNNVSFSYDNKKRNLSNINFKINSGEKVAIVGMNGSGKTTLINLLLRYYIPSSGKILMNNIEINNIRLDQYRNLFSVVSQDFYLFNRTIKENVGYRPSIKEGNIYDSLSRSGAYEFVDKLPQKINTTVGRNGSYFSGGERQKLALSRALASDSSIIVFDEGSSNVDIESENRINEVLIKELKEKIVLIISHKPQILKYVDKIIVLENGEIKNIGNYNELNLKGALSKYLK